MNDIVQERMEFHLRQFIPLLHKGIEFRAMSSWKAIMNAMTENITSALNTYLDNRFVFHVFENIDREHSRAWQQRPTGDKTREGEGKAKVEERARPPGAEREKKLFPSPRYVHNTANPQPYSSQSPLPHKAGLSAIGIANSLPLEADLDWQEEFLSEGSSAVPSLDYATPREGSSEHSNNDDDDDHELDAQALVMQLAAINEGHRPMMDAKPRAAVPGASACWHHLMGTCNKGKDCSFSHACTK